MECSAPNWMLEIVVWSGTSSSRHVFRFSSCSWFVATKITHQLIQLISHRTRKIVLIVSTSNQLAAIIPSSNRKIAIELLCKVDVLPLITHLPNWMQWIRIIADQFSWHVSYTQTTKCHALHELCFRKQIAQNGQWKENYALVKVPCQDIICYVFIAIVQTGHRKKRLDWRILKKSSVEKTLNRFKRHKLIAIWKWNVDCKRQTAKVNAAAVCHSYYRIYMADCGQNSSY